MSGAGSALEGEQEAGTGRTALEALGPAEQASPPYGEPSAPPSRLAFFLPSVYFSTTHPSAHQATLLPAHPHVLPAVRPPVRLPFVLLVHILSTHSFSQPSGTHVLSTASWDLGRPDLALARRSEQWGEGGERPEPRGMGWDRVPQDFGYQVR